MQGKFLPIPVAVH